MRRLIVVLWILLVPQTTFAIYTGKPNQVQAEFSPTRLIVKLRPEADKQITLAEVQGKVTTGLPQLDSLNFKFGVRKQTKLFAEFKATTLKSDKFSSVYVLEVPPGTNLREMKREYENRPEVEYAELDYKVVLFDAPDDPLFSNQWYLNNTGQGYLGINRVPGDYNDTQVTKYGTVDADVDALEAFERDDETTVPVVGIIDTGLDLDHPDLAGNVWTNPGEIPDNGIDDDHNGFVDDFYGWDFSGGVDQNNMVTEDNDPTDYYGHGTHCAGIVAAVRGNSLGVTGITTPCQTMAIKVFPHALHSVCAKGIIYAADIGCDVINMSWGGPYYSALLDNVLDYAISRGVLPVGSAGNSGDQDYFYPASLPQVLTVGASNSDDEVTDFSTYGEHISVVAPGEDVLSLRADTTDMYAEGGASGIEPYVHIVEGLYYLADGTSMSSPCVAGVAAYILSISPGTSGGRVREIIEQSADDIIYPYGGDTLYSPGWDIYSGHGRVNLNSALQLAAGRLAKIDYPYENAIVSGNVAVMGTASGDSFQSYVLEYGEGDDPTQWTEIFSSNVPVWSDTLGIWNSYGLVGLYTLRLTVGDHNSDLVYVVADNDVLVEITSPGDGDTIYGLTEIYGYSVIPDFSHYFLEYGYGESPSVWAPIDTSTKMVAGDLLGEFMFAYAEEMTISLRVRVEAEGGETYANTVVLLVKGVASSMLSVELVNRGCISPAMGDVDGDGFDEIVVGVGGTYPEDRTGGVEVFDHQLQREPGWPRDTDKNMMSPPALADLDGDGIDDIVICSKEVGVHAYLSNSPDWTASAYTEGGDKSLPVPVIADLEDDGSLEVLMFNAEGTVYAWRHDGQSVITDSNGVFAHAMNTISNLPALAVADLDRDGENEVIAGAARGACNPPPCWASGGIYIWDINGNLLLGPGDYPDSIARVDGIVIANIDQNEDLEIVAFGAHPQYYCLYAFKKDGSQPPPYPLLLQDLEKVHTIGMPPAVGDLEGDGILEIVANANNFILAWHQDGTPVGSGGGVNAVTSLDGSRAQKSSKYLSAAADAHDIQVGDRARTLTAIPSYPSAPQIPALVTAPEGLTFPVLADVNRDGKVDILTASGPSASFGHQKLWAWDLEGSLIDGFPLYCPTDEMFNCSGRHSPVIGDMDKDGKIDMAFVTRLSNWTVPKLVLWEFDTYYDSTKMHWPQYMHDNRRSGIFRPEDYSFWRGDANGDGTIDIGDVIYVLNYLYKGGPAPDPLEVGDANQNGLIDVGDAVYLLNYLFRQGPPPCKR
jgi:subtilisin family serine protease